jgi:thymidylate synthase
MNKELTKEEFLKKLKTDRDFNSRYGRKHITEGKMVLPPCHYGFQVYTRELSNKEKVDWVIDNCYETGMERYFVEQMTDEQFHNDYFNTPKRSISLMWNQRSCDVPLGIPFNIASYGLLLEIISKMVNMIPDELIGNLGDAHIYKNQVDGVKEQISRKPFELPTLKILDSNVDDIAHYELDDIVLEGYQSHPPIKMPLSN